MLTRFTFISGSVVYSHSYFGHGVGPNIISTLICSGTENSLLECDNDKYYALFSCGDGSVAGAICLGMIQSLLQIENLFLSFFRILFK